MQVNKEAVTLVKLVRNLGGADAAKKFRELLRRFYIQHIDGQVRKSGASGSELLRLRSLRWLGFLARHSCMSRSR